MPMQRIETIDEPRREAETAGNLELFEKSGVRRDDFRNRLIWGDNKLVMASLLKEVKGKIDLIYIDPPFDVGADFSMNVQVGDGDLVEKEQSTLEMVAYRDMWGKGTSSYLHMVYERLLLMRELLADTRVIYIHIGPGMSQLVKLVADDVFGPLINFLNQIIWRRTPFSGSSKARARKFPVNHDCILFYTKPEEGYSFSQVYEQYSEE
jgi:adenine-specific DNA-methyltransferase